MQIEKFAVYARLKIQGGHSGEEEVKNFLKKLGLYEGVDLIAALPKENNSKKKSTLFLIRSEKSSIITKVVKALEGKY